MNSLSSRTSWRMPLAPAAMPALADEPPRHARNRHSQPDAMFQPNPTAGPAEAEVNACAAGRNAMSGNATRRVIRDERAYWLFIGARRSGGCRGGAT